MRAAESDSEERAITPHYSRAERWLHWLALEPGVVRQLTFDLDRQFALPEPAHVAEAASGSLYVCGLARSGTTLVLHLLNQLDDFRSLSYRDMPFPLAPNLWRHMSRRSRREPMAAPRVHGDGMLVDFDSPEGFEEVFWRTFTSYTTDGGAMSASRPDPEAIKAFRDYRALVANPRQSIHHAKRRRYLSKNNNHLLRLRWLSNIDDGAVILVFRNPVAAARSMHATHMRFARENSDDFTRRYMAWLCHFEFGIDHKPFDFATTRMDKRLKPEQLDYWLDYWCAVHEHILGIEGCALRLLDYDKLCRYPMATMRALFDAVDIQADCAPLAAQVSTARSHAESALDPLLTFRANALHLALQQRPDNCR